MTSEQLNDNRGLLIVLSGPSGVGKDTLVDAYLARHPQAVASVSVTTRSSREGEQEGVHYFFLTRADFLVMKEQGDILESAEYEGNFYGTPRQKVEEHLSQGKHVFLIIEVEGAEQIRRLAPEAVHIFIFPPSLDCLRSRLSGRGTESTQAIENRLEVAVKEMAQATHYDYIIKNHTVDQSITLLESILIAAEHSPKHNTRLLKGVTT